MICGVWLICASGQDAAKIDLCPGLGQWRVQQLGKREHIIGLHSYVLADDESWVSNHLGVSAVQPHSSNQHTEENEVAAGESDDSSWIDSLGFIVYPFETSDDIKRQKRL